MGWIVKALITTVFSVEVLQLNTVIFWTLLELHHIVIFTARFTDSRKVYEPIPWRYINLLLKEFSLNHWRNSGVMKEHRHCESINISETLKILIYL